MQLGVQNLVFKTIPSIDSAFTHLCLASSKSPVMVSKVPNVKVVHNYWNSLSPELLNKEINHSDNEDIGTFIHGKLDEVQC